ncbi:MAG: HAMP domain-containing sensor histidine kinase, partial [Streptosporangiaceae bacterium]|jgi:signal transduction histidine kinase
MTSLRLRLGLRRRGFRIYLTAVYGGLFLVSGTSLLGLTYWLADTRFPVSGRHSGTGHGRPGLLPGQQWAAAPAAQAQSIQDRAAALHSLLLMSGIALAVMTVISVGLGWLVAGRMLRPLRLVTASARRISASNLHERLAMTGPDDELKELSDTFDGLLGRLERAFDAQRQFVANASHELRTPLARQRAFIEVALDDAGRTVDSLERACERVLVAGEQHERLIDALLTLAQSQRGLTLRGPVDLAAVVGDVLQTRLPEVQGRGLRVSTRLAAAAALGDTRLTERLAANLVANAILHNIPGGWIEIATGMSGGSAIFSVVNTGPVIPPAEVQRLFEPFQRLATDRVGGPRGSGLGLSIVKAIAGAHNVQLSAHARPGGGLEIQARFPEIPPDLPVDMTPAADAQRTAPSGSSSV